MPHLRTVHLYIGIIGVIAFLLTGQYMHWVYDHLQGMPEGPRLFLRSSHIYLLWSSLLNVVLGCYVTRLKARLLGNTQSIASLAIILGPLLLCTSFFVEQYTLALSRPMSRWAIYLAFGGVLSHALITALPNIKRGDT